jgi:hypothetical protein
MEKVSHVKSVSAAIVDTGPFDLPNLFVVAVGDVPTTGWSRPVLSPVIYIAPPADGIWDFNFLADPPGGVAGDAIMPIAGSYIGRAPKWLRGVRIHAAKNELQAAVTQLKPIDLKAKHAELFAARGAHFERQIASYEDSWQPIGMCSLVSVRMKKLVHELFLVVDGPDAGQIQHCVEGAFTAALVAAIVAAFVSGGAALPAAIDAATAALTGCLGNAYSVRFEDRSHWVEWCT